MLPRKIFLSHLREDTVYTEAAKEHLQSPRWEVWTCPPESSDMKRWPATLDRAIGNSDAAVLFLTPDYLDAEWIKSEELPKLLRRARSGCLRLFPVRIKSGLPLVDFGPHPVWPHDGKAVSELPRAKQKRFWEELRAAVGQTFGEDPPGAGPPVVFIGHGRSPVWEQLRDYLQKLGLRCGEFNQVSAAGVTHVDRLSELLDAASIAFIVMTAEDERPDGTLQPRMNVVHEAGLCQGRLGFNRTIILREKDCKLFSNIDGLGLIEFEAGNIAGALDKVGEVLKREGFLK